MAKKPIVPSSNITITYYNSIVINNIDCRNNLTTKPQLEIFGPTTEIIKLLFVLHIVYAIPQYNKILIY